MAETNPMTGQRITEFTESYMGKLFYFCLKKTGNSSEAEDLVQDIALNILTALNKGVCPVNFPAWVWQIARNRYSVWADGKHRKAESVTGSDIGDCEIRDDSESVLDRMIRSEQLALLRRELAFIGNEYRSIVVAYYIEDRSIRDIALSLNLSESAVKQRLYRARNILKEGMNMAREFGVRSYNPENITFASSGSQPSGLPWSAVDRAIPKNILLQANNNPSTVEELSMELGIALPYMEDEIAILHRATLLAKIGDKYITNFFILDKECRMDSYNALRAGAKERSFLLQEFLQDRLPDIRALGVAGGHIDDNTMKWCLLPLMVDYCIKAVAGEADIYHPAKRANRENWGFVGYEITDMPENTLMGHNGSGNGFWTYKCGDYGLWDQVIEPDYESTVLLYECFRNGRKVSDFSDMENRCWRGIDGKYAHADENGNAVPDIPVFRDGALDTIHTMLKTHRNYEKLLQNFSDAYGATEKILKKYNHKVLHDTMGYYIAMEMISARMMAVHDLVDAGFMQIPEGTGKSVLGMHMIID
ncbi:MAG: sigma-70 family RNA polymerase sigma factor [Clostridia bacterium]|nr:sigma-70 family RNA polymerase sigma factor [Clostridia bacterium]